ncbi:MAG TPA: NAD(P)H-dependent glycerol-3-phosphate dehydrogenase [Acidimicrobiales bacterium]
MTKVAVIGAGSWGTTIASMLAEKVDTVVWSRSGDVAREIEESHANSAYLGTQRLTTSLRATTDMSLALEAATLVVVAIPSHGLRSTLSQAGVVPSPGVAVVSLSKGLEEHTNQRMTEVLGEVWPAQPTALLTGPNLAEEVFDGQPTASVVATTDDALGRELQDLFTSDRLRIYTNPDVVGCEIAGVVKNVMAIACGMAVGLGYGDNTRAALITRALAELIRFGEALGGEPRTFAGLAGVGDLVATCTSRKSRNLSVGVALGEGRPLNEAIGGRSVAEGVRSSRAVVDLAARLGVDVPVADQVVAVCYRGQTPSDGVAALMGRAPRAEFQLDSPVQSGPRTR